VGGEDDQLLPADLEVDLQDALAPAQDLGPVAQGADATTPVAIPRPPPTSFQMTVL
jgi:hypothetical protein